MPLFDTDDGLTVAQEGRNARATFGHLDYLFVGWDRDALIATYTKFVAQARDFFGRRWRSVRGPNIDDTEFSDLTQKATLHWMYFYIVNRLPVWITEADWKHPQTHRIVQEIVERRFPTGSEETTMLCAHLTGLSRDAFVKWKEGDDCFLTDDAAQHGAAADSAPAKAHQVFSEPQKRGSEKFTPLLLL